MAFLWNSEAGVWIYCGEYSVRGGEVCNSPGTCTEPWRELAEEGDFSEEVAKEISVVKGNRISLEYYYSSCCPDEVFRQIYREYVKTCQARRKLDFDDMILYCYDHF